MQDQKEAHKVYSLIYHLFFVVKYRQKVFVDEIGITKVFKGKVNDLSRMFDVELLEIECGIDHVHLLISTKPTLDMPKFVNSIKGYIARFLRQQYHALLKNKLGGDPFWNPSYFIATTGKVSIDTLRPYIENQRRPPEREG